MEMFQKKILNNFLGASNIEIIQRGALDDLNYIGKYFGDHKFT